ncbi:hypothetical protein [Streptomyces sp. B6B3]|uniref:hypothetical protein n=1 Tax=Streptomyces sp. B6B3 TaxID=3153570 RepID=UPI00325D3BE2
MTAVTVEHPAIADVPLPDAERLTERQLLGIDCAHCGAYLGAHARRLGDIEDCGYLLQLFGCDPRCVPLPRRESAPPWRGSPLDRLPRWTAATDDSPDPLADDYDTDPATLRRVVAGLRALPDTTPAPQPGR